MATIPRTYLTTSKHGLSSITPKNGQVISIWDSDEVWYDAPIDGSSNGTPVRRKISGVRVVSELPAEPMEGMVYVYLDTNETLPDGNPLYEILVWAAPEGNYTWVLVGTNRDDCNVKTAVSNDKFYLVGTADATTGAIGTLLKNSAVFVQNGVINGDLQGTASEATHASQSDTATVAINDDATPSQKITSYLHDVDSDATTDLGTTLTFTLGNGNTKPVRISNTTYDIFTATTAGLVDATNNTVSQDSTNLLLSGKGWMSRNDIVMPLSDKSNKDASGQTLTTTYIKGLSYDTSTELLTVTKGSGSTSTISIPDTTYSVFDTSTDGLVPAPSGEGSMFLRGDQTWQPVVTTDYQGATSIDAGVHGLVPAASSGDTDKYLRSDGTWNGVFGQNSNGLVPGPTTADSSLSLKADGTWTACPDTTNTTGTANDVSNKLYIVGGATQNSSGVITYTNQNVFIDSNKLYQLNNDDPNNPASVQVVDVSSAQTLSNKSFTISGSNYTLGTACSAPKSTVLDPNDASYDSNAISTNGAVVNYVTGRISTISSVLPSKANNSMVAPDYDNTATYAQGSYCIYDDGNGAVLYKSNTAITAAEDFDSSKWDATTLIDIINSL